MPSSTSSCLRSASSTYPADSKMMSVMLPGASRISTKISTDMPSSVTPAITIRLMTYVRMGRLLVQPDVLTPTHVVDGILVHRPALDVRPVHPVLLAPAEDGTRPVRLQLVVDLVDQRQALGAVERLRLLDHEPVDLLRAVPREVALRAAAVVLEELRVGIIHAYAGEVERHLVFEARHLRVPHARLDLLQRGLDADLLHLVDHPARRVDVDRQRARGHGELQGIARPESGLREELAGLGLLPGLIALPGKLRHFGGGEAPHARGAGQQCAAERGGTLTRAHEVRLAIEREVD